jgi:hypothetical protein
MQTFAPSIVNELRNAFPAVRRDRLVSLVNSVEGDEPASVADEFRNKLDWTKLDPAWLDTVPLGAGTALHLLSDEAICFYIPAYISADLECRLACAEPVFSLTHGFDNFSRGYCIRPPSEETWTDYGVKRWSHLTKAQALAIAHYLEWRIEKYGPDIEHSSVEALKSYWYERASG